MSALPPQRGQSRSLPASQARQDQHIRPGSLRLES